MKPQYIPADIGRLHLSETRLLIGPSPVGVAGSDWLWSGIEGCDWLCSCNEACDWIPEVRGDWGGIINGGRPETPVM